MKHKKKCIFSISLLIHCENVCAIVFILFAVYDPNRFDTEPNGIKLASLPNVEPGNNPLFNYNNQHHRAPNQEAFPLNNTPLAPFPG